MKEKLAVFLEPDNEVGKYIFCLNRKHAVGDHLPWGKNLKFLKMIFYFLRVGQYTLFFIRTIL